ncbi:expressed unknown protein [Seminavis robusta]|uniref:Ubiquitin-like domain-containing protein n=1 Tax=Seminavis robusta TaxID=568900 RepID=A0A9N8H7S8_9STRA|nr:expressed unknown protein [Seminavis robusta]|eukprot:Sro138_g064710.1 n/a (625) ;mRNA; f:40248-42209
MSDSTTLVATEEELKPPQFRSVAIPPAKRQSAFRPDLKLYVKNVRDGNQPKKAITVPSGSTIQGVKLLIQYLMDVPVNAQRLYFGPFLSSGSELPNHRTLHDAGIYRSGETLFLEIKDDDETVPSWKNSRTEAPSTPAMSFFGSSSRHETKPSSSSSPSAKGWAVPKLQPVPIYYPLDEKSSRVVEDDLDNVMERLANCFRSLSLQAVFNDENASVHLTDSQGVEMDLKLWKATGEKTGVVVELQRRRSDATSFHRWYLRHILDAAKRDDTTEHKKAVSGAIEIAHGLLLSKDRGTEHHRLGLEDLHLLTDPDKTTTMSSATRAAIRIIDAEGQFPDRGVFENVLNTVLDKVIGDYDHDNDSDHGDHQKKQAPVVYHYFSNGKHKPNKLSFQRNGTGSPGSRSKSRQMGRDRKSHLSDPIETSGSTHDDGKSDTSTPNTPDGAQPGNTHAELPCRALPHNNAAYAASKLCRFYSMAASVASNSWAFSGSSSSDMITESRHNLKAPPQQRSDESNSNQQTDYETCLENDDWATIHKVTLLPGAFYPSVFPYTLSVGGDHPRWEDDDVSTLTSAKLSVQGNQILQGSVQFLVLGAVFGFLLTWPLAWSLMDSNNTIQSGYVFSAFQ